MFRRGLFGFFNSVLGDFRRWGDLFWFLGVILFPIILGGVGLGVVVKLFDIHLFLVALHFEVFIGYFCVPGFFLFFCFLLPFHFLGCSHLEFYFRVITRVELPFWGIIPFYTLFLRGNILFLGYDFRFHACCVDMRDNIEWALVFFCYWVSLLACVLYFLWILSTVYGVFFFPHKWGTC